MPNHGRRTRCWAAHGMPPLRCAGLLFVVLIATVLQANPPDERESKTLRVASLSIMPAKWDKRANAQRIETQVREAARRGAKLVITPEGVLEGYVVNQVIEESDRVRKAQLVARFRKVAEPIDGPYLVRFRELADALDLYLILGFLEIDGDKLFNTAALLGPDGRLVGRYHKTHFHQGYDVNPPGYTPGAKYPVFDIGPLKVGIMICFDRQLPEPARQLTLGGADLIACPSYGGWGDWNTRIMQVRAYENQSYVVFTHPQQSLILARDGSVLATGSQDGMVIVDLDVSDLTKNRQSVTRRRPETYRAIGRSVGERE
ncbi:MAG: carbon-nitrogen hydrolase family protein [Pirellulales bacterium]